MKRRKAREYVLHFLYAWEINGYIEKEGNLEILQNKIEEFWEINREEDVTVKSFANQIIKGTIENLYKIDKIIQKYAQGWSLDRMLTIDKNILRFAVYEIVYRDDIPYQVSINEAIEIAKKYSTKEAAAFINGVLDRIAKQEMSASSGSGH
ncbi:MAG: transcription antitermination factor NusB [Thermodesulfovibrionaceae bacterium]